MSIIGRSRLVNFLLSSYRRRFWRIAIRRVSVERRLFDRLPGQAAGRRTATRIRHSLTKTKGAVSCFLRQHLFHREHLLFGMRLAADRSGGFSRMQTLFQRFYVGHQGFMVKDQRQQNGKGCDQQVHRYDQPEPGPVFCLPRELPYRNGTEDLRREERQKVADGIIFDRPPDIGSILVADIEERFPIAQGDISQLRLEYLIEHNKQHQQKQSRRRAEYPLIGQLVVAQQHRQQRHRQYHPVVIIEPEDIQQFPQLIGFCHGFLGIKQSNQAAENADIEHVVLHLFIFGEEQEREQTDIGTADIHEPAVPEHSCLIDRVGRNIHFQKMHQKARRQQSEQNRLLGALAFPPQKIIQRGSGTGAKQQPEEVPPVKHCDIHTLPSVSEVLYAANLTNIPNKSQQT